MRSDQPPTRESELMGRNKPTLTWSDVRQALTRVPDIGWTWQRMKDHFEDPEQLRSADASDIAQVDGVGGRTAERVVEALSHLARPATKDSSSLPEAVWAPWDDVPSSSDACPAWLEPCLEALGEAAAIGQVLLGADTLAALLVEPLNGLVDTSQFVSLDHIPGANDPWGLCSAIDEWWQGLDDRQRLIVSGRTLAPDPATLEALAGQLDLTRERVRQIERGVSSRLEQPKLHDAWARMSAGVARVLGPVAPADALDQMAHRFSGMLLMPDDLARKLFEAHLPYQRHEHLLVRDDIHESARTIESRAADSADPAGVVNLAAIFVGGALDELGLSRDELLELAGLVRIRDHWVLRDTKRVRLRLALEDLGTPATKDEITRVAEIDGERYVTNMLAGEPDIVRVTADTWGFEDWTDDPYDGIVGEIIQRIQEGGGETSRSRLIAEIPDRFGVSPRSVTTYLGTPQFDVRGDRVGIAASPSVTLRSLDDVADVFWDGDEAVYSFRMEERYLRGYSVLVPNEVAKALGADLGASIEVPIVEPDVSTTASVIWSPSSPTGPNVGRLREALTVLGAKEDDQVFLWLQPEGIRLSLDGTALSASPPTRQVSFTRATRSDVPRSAALERLKERRRL